MSKVVIENVGKVDNGFYVCMADNQIRSPDTKSVHVHVVCKFISIYFKFIR